jgi:VWFA-related protein
VRLGVLMAVLMGASFTRAQETPPAVPAFPAVVELITVDAVVLDRDGRPVPGLTRDDFAVSEDGKPQTIATFEAFDLRGPAAAREVPRLPDPVATNVRPAPGAGSSFVLLVDDVGLAPARAETVRTALARFVSEGVRDGDELVFATTSGSTWWTARMPEGREDVLALAARVRGRSLRDDASDAVSEWEAYRIVRFDTRGGDGGSAGMSARPPSDPGQPSSSVPGMEMTQRVVDRYYQRRVCIPPDPPFPGTPVPVCRAMVQRRAQEVDARRANRTRDVLAAVDRAVFAMSSVRGRKSLLLLTEGFLNDPDLDVAGAVAGRCREANVAIYTLDVRGLLTGLSGAESAGVPNTAELGLMRMEQVDAAAAGSVELAEETGGLAIRDTNDIGGGAVRVGDESRVYYLLGYTPPPGKGPRDWRKLKVEVKRPGLTVRARKGYTLRTTAEILAADEARLAPKPPRPHASKPRAASASAEPPLPADMARALAGPHDAEAIPLRAMPYVFEERPGKTLRTVLTVEIDTRALSNLGGEEHPRTSLSLSIAVMPRDTGQVRRVNQRIEVEAGGTGTWQGWLAVNREFELPPGVVQARVIVRDEFLGRLGAVTARFVVPPASGLRVSTPILTPRTWRSREGLPPQPVLVARREFEPSGLLYCHFEVFGAAAPGGRSALEAAVELRGRAGEVVRRDPRRSIEPTLDGRLIRFLSFPLDGLADGDYELRLQVEDRATGEVRERVEPLRLSGGAAPR